MSRRKKSREIDLSAVISQALAGETGATRAAALRLAGHAMHEIACALAIQIGPESEPALVTRAASIELAQHREW